MLGHVVVAITYVGQGARTAVPKPIHDRRLCAIDTRHFFGSENDPQIRMGNLPIFYVVDDVSR